MYDISNQSNPITGGLPTTNEPRQEKTCIQGVRPGPTQTRLYSRREDGQKLEMSDLGSIDVL